MMRRSVTLHLVSAVALAVALLSPAADAQRAAGPHGDPVAARTLFDEGRTLAAEGKHPLACPKFEESYKLDPGMGTLFNLADCWEHIGRTASAWARFLQVADAANRAGQKDREKIARDRAAALEPKLSRLIVQVKSADRGVELTRDGAPFGSAQWGTALPIDPGRHTIEAKAPSKQAWKRTVEVVANGQTVTVTVPALANEPEQPAAPSAVTEKTPAPQPVAAPPAKPRAFRVTTANQGPAPETTESSGRVGAAWALGGFGVLGLALGTVFGLRVESHNDEADSACPSGVHCLPSEISRYNEAIADAKSARTASYISFGLGIAGLTTGAIMLLTAHKWDSKGVQVGPAVGTGTVGATVAGAW